MSQPLVSLRLYPEPGTRFVRVMVWPTYRAMEAHRRAAGQFPCGGVASCTDIHRIRVLPNGRSRRDPCVAEVNFQRSRLGMEIVTHELFHATIAWGRRIGFDWRRFGEEYVNDDEERLTYVHGRLCAEFVSAADRCGLYDPDRWRTRTSSVARARRRP